MNTVEYLTIWLSEKLNEEMKNILQNNLTKENESDIIDLSNEREVTKFE